MVGLAQAHPNYNLNVYSYYIYMCACIAHARMHTHTQTHTHSTHRHTDTHVTCEKSAKAGSANSGACPMSSWQTSGSGVYHGLDECLIY